MREDLLGYLLGALESDEARRVENLLRRDPAARQQLRELEASLRPLETDNEIFEPPADLIGRTFAKIDASQVCRSDTPSANPSRRHSQSMPSSVDDGRWRVADVLVAAISMIALGGLILPSILESRFEARRARCQTNLQQLGTSLAQYAINHPDGRLPSIDLEGPLAFAGVFSVRLKEQDLLDGEHVIWCASRDLPESVIPIPTKSQLQQVTNSDLVKLQRVAGGHLAYTLGVMRGDTYEAPRYEGRSTFAVLGDAPIRQFGGRQLAHDGRGYNLLYEDGRVRFISASTPLDSFDHPFVNEDNKMEAGLNVNDSSLGESSRAPFVWVNQSL